MNSGKWVGRALKRKEDRRLLVGEGQYVADMKLPRMVYAGFVRSPHAHAKILEIDATRALAVPGVIAVMTGRDFAQYGPILSDLSVPKLPGETKRPIFSALPVDEVGYVGDLVAVVIAKDKYAVEDGIDAVDVEYEPLPAVIEIADALKPDAPLVYPEWGDNVVYHQHLVNGDVDAAFAKADHVIRERFICPRNGASPMETRATIANYGAAEGLTAWLTTQRSHIKRHLLAEYFKLPDSQVRVIAPMDVGGGFGVKAPLYREDIAVCAMAMKLRRPVKWVENRQENLLNIGQERDQIHEMSMAITKDGRITALRDRMYANCGDARVPIYIGIAMPWLGMMYLTNAYDIPNIDVDLTCVVSHKAGLTPSRAFGSFTGRFAIDRMVDLAAKKLGMDVVEIRRRNAISKFPHVTAAGVHCDSGDFDGALTKACGAIDYAGFRTLQAEARAKGRYLGVGFSLGLEFSGLSSQILVPMERQPGFGVATVRFDANGNVQVAHGDQPQGQGHDTVLSQVVADELGITPDDVRVISGDTQSAPFAAGTLASRMASYTVSAAYYAARGLRTKMASIAAHLLGVPDEPEAFAFADGEAVWTRDPAKRLTVARIAETALLAPTELPTGMEGGLENTSHFEADAPGMQSTNAHAVIVEAFPETGRYKILRYVAVDDSGLVLNPLIVRGQIQGGIALGISNACFEEFHYTADGQQTTASLAEYLMASSADLPHIETHEHNVPTPHNPLGSKGKGEGPTGMVPGALGNALEDALAPFGVRITELPMTYERIWKMLEDRRRDV
ncbi:MAG TPA: xanthine dehydrogenase family protein molybdopterin-binding subunit [Gammaproteobacteria bacterium]|nr:xanthine dehydrogenase family protein molybdopterin-binding subunit [Gammaproteobacteria bacterium]